MLNNILEIAIFTNFLLVAISLILVTYAFVKNGIDKGHIITIYSYLVHAFIFYFCRLFLYSQILGRRFDDRSTCDRMDLRYLIPNFPADLCE